MQSFLQHILQQNTNFVLRYVSEVVIGAPYTVDENLMKHFNVDLVVHGSTSVVLDAEGGDPYAVPKQQDKFKIILTAVLGLFRTFIFEIPNYEFF